VAILAVPLGDPPLPPLETATLVAIYTGLEVGVTQGAWKSMAKECLIARGEGGVIGEADGAERA
jgi:hypothetical protein